VTPLGIRSGAGVPEFQRGAVLDWAFASSPESGTPLPHQQTSCTEVPACFRLWNTVRANREEESVRLGALDPCAGKGEALAQLCGGLGLKPYGIELDEKRAEDCHRNLTGPDLVCRPRRRQE